MSDSVLAGPDDSVLAKPTVSANTQPLRMPQGTLASIAQKPPLLSVGDIAGTRRSIFDRVQQAASNFQPLQDGRRQLSLSDVHYHPDDPEDFGAKAHKQAILENRTLGRRLRGTFVLNDLATGQELDRKKVTLATVPWLSGDGTFINNGVDTSLSHQMRLRPGAYARIKSSGETEVHVNVLPGKGPSHRYRLDPETGKFVMEVHQANLPLMPLLRAAGITDKEMEAAWGPRGRELVQIQHDQDTPNNLARVYKAIAGRGAAANFAQMTRPEQHAAVAALLPKWEVDPAISQRTLGKPYATIDKDALLAITSKLVKIAQGEVDVDDRDHLAHQTVFGPDDLLAERIARDYGRVQRGVFREASRRGNLQNVSANVLQKQLMSVFTKSGLANALEEANPSEILDRVYRISRMGEGGLPSTDSIPQESRMVSPSHYGYIDPARTTESLRVGVDLYLASKLRRDQNGNIYSPVRNLRTGETEWKTPQEVADLPLGFDEKSDRKHIPAIVNGKLQYARRNNVQHRVEHFEDAFSPLAQLIPMKSGTAPQRVAMGSRMYTQAVALTNPEAPLVRGAMPENPEQSYEDHYGTAVGALRADQPGQVLLASPDNIRVRYADGTIKDIELDNNRPMNRKSFRHQTPMVEPGQEFQPGDLLAKSNYTDDKGVMALGANFRTGYMPWKGLNHEDAIVISQSAAKRLTSEHAYQHTLDRTDDMKFDKKAYQSVFKDRFSQALLNRLDDDGVIKPGQPIEYGEPLAVALTQQAVGGNKLLRGNRPISRDASVLWEHHAPGIVTDVAKTKDGINVVVKSQMPMQTGDKLAPRYGDKGVVHILPDDEMPQTKDGKPLEIIVSDLGVLSRANPAQVAETLLGKIARKTGKPINVPDFKDIDDLVDWADRLARQHGLSAQEDLIDPKDGSKIPSVLTGDRFFMKLHHQAESKGQGRGIGGYSSDERPMKGGETGSKTIGLLQSNAIMSHGTTGLLRDAATVRGQANPDHWMAIRQGIAPPRARVPFTYEKFVNELKAGGINAVGDGTQMHVMGLTDKDIDALAGKREIQRNDLVRLDEKLAPVRGGLFDESLTGGHNGNLWSRITTPEPMPNPVMQDPIRRMLGLTEDKFRQVLAGRESIKQGSGPQAIYKALDQIDIPKELDRVRKVLQTGRKSDRDLAERQLGYLKGAEKTGMHPREWMLNSIPVLPPKFRPISLMQHNDQPLVSDINYLYREAMDARDNLKDMIGQVDDVGDERLGLYDSFRAITGLVDPQHPKLVEKNVSGVLQRIFGKGSAKYGTLQRKLLSRQVDLVGRAVVVPNPDLDMDSIGLPEHRVWPLYSEFVVRRLKKRGFPLVRAMQEVENRTPLARDELQREMEYRPVFVDRAPVLHRFGTMAFYPRLVKGDSMHVSPAVLTGFAMDFDGDAAQYHVPASDDAIPEILERMLPSRNLLSPADFHSPMYVSGKEFIGGLFAATRPAREGGHTTRFLSKKDALAAARRGDMPLDAQIEVDDD